MRKKQITFLVISFFFFSNLQSQIKEDNPNQLPQLKGVNLCSKPQKIKNFETSLKILDNQSESILDSLIEICENQELEEGDKLHAARLLTKIKSEKATIYSLRNINLEYDCPLSMRSIENKPFFINLFNRCDGGEILYFSILKVLKEKKSHPELYKYSQLLYTMFGSENSGLEKSEFLLKQDLKHSYQEQRKNILQILNILESFKG